MTSPGQDDPFTGQYRKDVKTSIWRVNGAIATPEPPQDVASLLAPLPLDADIRPRADASPTSRLPEEQRNVTVSAFLHYVRKETDNDYHLILGSTADANTTYMTAEVSGLPAGGPDLDTLRQVRAQLVTLIGHEPGPDNYQPQNPPRSVQVTGSLFFDAGHSPNEVGPDTAKTPTVWEIHPVINLQ